MAPEPPDDRAESFADDGRALLADLARWAAGERAAQAAAARARTRSLALQSAAGATVSGVLVDLAERRSRIGVSVGGTRLAGRLNAVGKDFCVLEQSNGRPAIVALAAIGAVWVDEQVRGDDMPAGNRRPPNSLSLAAALDALAAERAPVALATAAAGGPLDGELHAAGEDFVTLRTGVPPRRTIHVPLASIAYVELR